jgi:hypothetical protein
MWVKQPRQSREPDPVSRTGRRQVSWPHRLRCVMRSADATVAAPCSDRSGCRVPPRGAESCRGSGPCRWSGRSPVRRSRNVSASRPDRRQGLRRSIRCCGNDARPGRSALGIRHTTPQPSGIVGCQTVDSALTCSDTPTLRPERKHLFGLVEEHAVVGERECTGPSRPRAPPTVIGRICLSDVQRSLSNHGIHADIGPCLGVGQT